MFERFAIGIAVCALAISLPAQAKECWALTNLKGQIALSTERYAFAPDAFSNPIVLCFNDDKTGTLTNDDTPFVRFGPSTLIGFVRNQGIELVESYQIDRDKGKVLFIKSRIGTATVLPGVPDLAGAFVGTATRLKE